MSPGAVVPIAVRQRDVLRLAMRYQDATGDPATVEYLAKKLGIHRKTVQQHLDALYRKGYLCEPSPRGLRCTHQPD